MNYVAEELVAPGIGADLGGAGAVKTLRQVKNPIVDGGLQHPDTATGGGASGGIQHPGV